MNPPGGGKGSAAEEVLMGAGLTGEAATAATYRLKRKF